VKEFFENRVAFDKLWWKDCVGVFTTQCTLYITTLLRNSCTCTQRMDN